MREEQTVTVFGKEYKVGVPGPWEYMAVGEFLSRRQRKRFLETIWDMKGVLPADEWEKEWTAAKEQAAELERASAEEVNAWLSTNEGYAYMVWLLIVCVHPDEFTWEEFVRRYSRGEAEKAEPTEPAKAPEADKSEESTEAAAG